MIGKLLEDGRKILDEKGILNMKKGAETGNVQKINCDYNIYMLKAGHIFKE